jgi:hypothetical protein
MPHYRSLSAGYLPVPQSDSVTQDIISHNNANGKLEKEQNQSGTALVSKSSSERQAYCTEMLQKDFSKPQYSKEKYFEHCKALQALVQELYAENEKLRSEVVAAANARPRSPSIRRTTDESEKSQKKLLPVPSDDVAVVFNLSDNGLRTMRGNEIREYSHYLEFGSSRRLIKAESNYIQADLPHHHWWRRESFHLYFSKSGEGKNLKADQPRVIVVRRKQQTTSDRDVNFIRTINLGKLGFGVRWKRFRGRLTSIYVLAPEPRPRRSPEMAMSKSTR